MDADIVGQVYLFQPGAQDFLNVYVARGFEQQAVAVFATQHEDRSRRRAECGYRVGVGGAFAQADGGAFGDGLVLAGDDDGGQFAVRREAEKPAALLFEFDKIFAPVAEQSF